MATWPTDKTAVAELVAAIGRQLGHVAEPPAMPCAASASVVGLLARYWSCFAAQREPGITLTAYLLVRYR